MELAPEPTFVGHHTVRGSHGIVEAGVLHLDFTDSTEEGEAVLWLGFTLVEARVSDLDVGKGDGGGSWEGDS